MSASFRWAMGEDLATVEVTGKVIVVVVMDGDFASQVGELAVGFFKREEEGTWTVKGSVIVKSRLLFLCI